MFTAVVYEKRATNLFQNKPTNFLKLERTKHLACFANLECTERLNLKFSVVLKRTHLFFKS